MSDHNPTLLSSRYGSWAVCTCGWQSKNYRKLAGANQEFNEHLIAANHPTLPEPPRMGGKS